MYDAFAWPGAFVVLGFAFFVIFRKPINALIGRTKSVTKAGLETFESPQLPAPAENPDALKNFLATYDNQLLLEMEGRIVEDLKVRGIVEPGPAKTALVRSLAGTQLLLLFVGIHSNVYASQVAALTALNGRNESIPIQELTPFYEGAKSQFPDLYQAYGFDDWFGFMERWQVVERQGRMTSITRLGHEFLKWRIEARMAGPFHG